MKTEKVPGTRAEEIVEDLFGFKVEDPYRWLEENKGPEAKKWMKIQNDYADYLLKKNSEIKKIEKELKPFFDTGDIGTPIPRNGRYFWDERGKGKQQQSLYFRQGINGKRTALVDPNKIDRSGLTSLSNWSPSPKGNYVAYGLSEKGMELSKTHIIDVNKRNNLKEIIPNTMYETVKWLPDETGFFYVRFPEPGSVPEKEKFFHRKVCFHLLGENPKEDELIFENELETISSMNLSISDEGRYLATDISVDRTKNDVALYDISKKKSFFIVKGIDATFNPKISGDRIYLRTSHKSPNYKIISAPIDDIPSKIERWETIIPEDQSILRDFHPVNAKIILNYLENAQSKIKIFDLKNRKTKDMPLPKNIGVGSITYEHNRNEVFFSVNSFLSPKRIYRYDLEGKLETYHEDKNGLDEAKFFVRQEWYKSRDGTKVPMFIVGLKKLKLDGKNPLLLRGYGGFASMGGTPRFWEEFVPFLKLGGIFVFANIRGGGEFGKEWHRGGICGKKQNSFDDFIGAAEHLIKKKYTSSEKLAISGASNGGLLVSACLTQRPEFYKAVICEVPFIDIVRFHKSPMAGRWVHEYGNPNDPKELETILKWSPYNNVKNRDYPSTLFMVGENDIRTPPFHGWKMGALLQSVSKNPVLIKTLKDAGHSPGKPKKMIIRENAEKLAFLFWQLGMNGK
jgi:prolyl oligopeptidase